MPAETTAVALTVAVPTPTVAFYLTNYASDHVRRACSYVICSSALTIANMVMVPVGPGNTVTFYSANGSGGTVDVFADILGHFQPGTGGGDRKSVV